MKKIGRSSCSRFSPRFLTAFYMLRLVVVVFFGQPRSDQAARGSEAPWVMTVPLIILAIPAFASGFGFVATFSSSARRT